MQEVINLYDEASMDFDGVGLGTLDAIAAFLNGLGEFRPMWMSSMHSLTTSLIASLPPFLDGI